VNFRGRFRRDIGSGNETTPLNWSRGLLRLWILVSAVWIMGWAIYAILSVLAQSFKTLEDYLAIPVVFFGPPIALLLCGLATAWAIRGFKLDEKPEQSPRSTPRNKVVQLRDDLLDDYVS
jgi:hypothetical protein